MAFTPLTEVKKTNFKPLNFDQSQAALSQSQSVLDTYRAQAATAKAAADKANSTVGIAQETAKGTLGTIADTGLKFLQSAIHAPGDIINGLMGKAPDTTTQPNFSGTGQQTFQGEFQSKTLPAVNSGEFSPLAATAQTTGGIVGGAADVLGASEGLSLLKNPIKKVSGLLTDYATKRAEKKATQISIQALTPKMTPGELEEAAKAGKVRKTILGTPKVDFSTDKEFVKTAEAVKGLVKGKSAIQDVNNVNEALSNEAEHLVTKVKELGRAQVVPDPVARLGELNAKLKKVDIPISVRGTPFEKQVAPLQKALTDIVQKNGYLPENLLQSRKEFDQLVEKTWPNLYESENAPMRNAVRATRNAMNDFIEESLPKEAGFKESLDLQRRYYDAIDNIATKVPDEVKKGGFPQKVVGVLKNPVVQAGLGVAGYNELKQNTPLGELLP